MTDSVARNADDGRELAATESDLAYDYPNVELAQIHTLVQRSYAAMTPAKVHNYLPVLIGRDVRAQLRAQAVA